MIRMSVRIHVNGETFQQNESGRAAHRPGMRRHKRTSLSLGGVSVRARISRWILGATLAMTLALGGAMISAMPAHAQSINGLGQAGPQFSKCQPETLDDGACGASSHQGGGARWQLSNPLPEPAVGFVPTPCRRGPESE